LEDEKASRTKYDLSPSENVRHFTISALSWYFTELMTMALVFKIKS